MRRRWDETLPGRFWDKVAMIPEHGCWEWTGTKVGPYGGFVSLGKIKKAHRYSWELANKQQIPPGHSVCHRCDNPMCVNPEHLFVGTQSDNMRDMVGKGRHARTKSGPRGIPTSVIQSILTDLVAGAQQRPTARKYGVSQTYVWLLSRGRSRTRF